MKLRTQNSVSRRRRAACLMKKIGKTSGRADSVAQVDVLHAVSFLLARFS